MDKVASYERIYADIRSRILGNEYPKGTQLPTEAALQKQYGVSRITVKNAMEKLRAEALIERFPGKGTFVSNKPLGKPFVTSFGMEKKPSDTIAILLPALYPSFGCKLICGVAQAANEHGLCLMTGLNYSTVEEETKLIHRQISNGVKGIIAVPVHSESEINTGIIQCAMDGFPIVFADRYLDGIQIPYVGSDHLKGAYYATKYLLNLGHTAIGLISSAPTTSAIVEREQGYMRAYAMTNNRIHKSYLTADIRSTMPGGNAPDIFESDVERMKKYFRDNPQVTALLCIDYKILKVCTAAAKAMGIRIPEDLSVVCFDAPDDDVAEHEYTYVRQPEAQIGRTAVDLLMKTIGGDRQIGHITLPTVLCEGTSTLARTVEEA